MRAFTPASISFLSWGVSGHGYNVALKLNMGKEANMRLWQENTTWYTSLNKIAAHLPLTDLLHSILQLVSLEEDNEDWLVDLVPLREHHAFGIKTKDNRLITVLYFCKVETVKSYIIESVLLLENWLSLGPPEGLQYLPVSGTHFLCKLSTTSSQMLEYVPFRWLRPQICNI